MNTTRRVALTLTAALAIGGLVATGCGDGDDAARSTTTARARQTTSTTVVTTAPGSTGTSQGQAATTAPATLVTVLRRAVQEERHAEATYRNVIAALGQILPFTNIADSEAQHVAALVQVAGAHGVDVSDITSSGEPSPTTKRAACALGVSAERADVALYDELLPQVTAYPDVTRVLTNLRTASQDSHLPAFERCA